MAADLLAWYDEAKRDLPWRRTRDPYAILVSELMLQQTQVKTVIPYFEKFMARFPDPDALAAAGEQELLKMWQGLGYYRRARHLQAAAREIRDTHGGKFPTDKPAIDALPGVGPYTAAAVASIALELPHACVDGNVYRVISRMVGIDDDIQLTATKKRIAAIAQERLDEQRPGDFNQAMMELGATVCTPRKPCCMTCPVNAFCTTHREGGNPEARPLKSKRVKPTRVDFESILIFGGGEMLLAHRKPRGLMAGMWELPTQDAADFNPWEELLDGQIQNLGRLEKPVVHRFTHLHASYRVTIYRCETKPRWRREPDAYQAFRWVGQQDFPGLPITRVLQKTLPELTVFLKGEQPCQAEPSTLPGMPNTH